MAQGKVTTREDFAVGYTLSASINPCRMPFTDESFKAFVKLFTEKDQNNPDDHGTFHFFTTLAQDQTQNTKALGVDGKLDFSYGPVSGDANVQFAMDNIQGSLTTSVVIRAEQRGRVVKNTLDEVVDLKIRENVAKSIAYKTLTFEQFKQDYGEYLIIGFEYGGQVLFKSTFTTNSSEDKLSVSGGLSVSYGKMGFNISGAVNGDYKSEDVSKSTHHTTEYDITPSFDDPLINGDDGIITLLNKISNPNQNGVNVDNGGDDQKYGDIAGEVQAKIQKLLGGIKLDKINCIVLPILYVPCISDAFPVADGRATKAFLKFANPLYMTMSSMLKGLQVVDANYDKLDAKDKPTNIINKWFEALNKRVSLMDSIDGAEIYEYAELYAKTLKEEKGKTYKINKRPKDDTTDDEKEDKDSTQTDGDGEIDKPFYKMDKDVLQNEFDDAIMKPYNEMLKKHKIDVDKYVSSKVCRIALKSNRGKYVSLESDNTLVANAEAIGKQQTFYSVSVDARSSKIGLFAANDNYLSATPKDQGARINFQPYIDYWEAFTVEVIDEQKQLYALKTCHNTYITVHDDSKLAVDADKVGQAEIFTITGV